MKGNELRKRREALDFTQAHLAEQLGVAANTVARWERDERSIPPTVPLALETIERRRSDEAASHPTPPPHPPYPTAKAKALAERKAADDAMVKTKAESDKRADKRVKR
jgi:transcriptional regulator with XRE-family HTH domain